MTSHFLDDTIRELEELKGDITQLTSSVEDFVAEVERVVTALRKRGQDEQLDV